MFASFARSLIAATRVLPFAPTLLPAAGTEQHSFTAVHDTFIQRGSTANNGSGTTLAVKREGAAISGGTDRVGYLRFDVPGRFSSVADATLCLAFRQYPGDGTSPFTFRVYGLPDGHANEDFDEATLNSTTARNASKRLPGSLDPAGLSDLGSFTPPLASGTPTVAFSSTALHAFLAANRNQRVSFILFRTSPHGAASYLYSRQVNNPAQRPTLLVRSASDALEVVATTAAESSLTLTLDLGAIRAVNRIGFIADQHGRSYRLESSPDTRRWTTLIASHPSGSGSAPNTLRETTTRHFPLTRARYFRLRSLTPTKGKGLPVQDVKLYHRPGIDASFERLARLASPVAALPDSTNPEQLKRVVLELALERARASLEAGEIAHAAGLLDDAGNHLAADPVAMAAPIRGLPHMRVLRPLKETSPATNPYLKRLAEGATLFLAAPDPLFLKNTASHNVFADFNHARRTAEQMDTLFWVFAHPDSPLRHHPELLRRLLRRTYAYLDAIKVHGPTLAAGQLASFYDDFAIAPASTVFREFQALYPGLCPPNSTAEWNQAMAIATDNLWAAFAKRKAGWVNTDVAIAVELFNFGHKAGRQDLLDKARYFIDDVLTSGRMFPDGAVGYIGTQNEAGGYQGTVASYVNRYYEITGYAPALEILEKMEWYGPINGPMIDWWTSPSWKHAWNSISGSGQTGEATNGRNPYVRAAMDASIMAAATPGNWIGQQANVAWYQRGTKSLPHPDGTLFDRNIQGPRAWKGRWNHTGTLRAIHDSEPGHHTLVGCQILEDPTLGRVHASMMGIFPRIRISSQPSRDSEKRFSPDRHAWLTSKLVGDSIVTPEFSTLAASYKPHVFGSSTKGPEHAWTARQVWINLPDRMIGLLDLSPDTKRTAFEVQGAIRLGYGGTAYSAPKSLVATGADSWAYGDLTVKLHDHNFAAVTPEVYAFRTPQAPFTEITLRDQADGATNTTAKEYKPGSRWRFIVEIRPKSTTTPVTVTETTEAGGLVGLEVRAPDSGRTYRVLYNPGRNKIDHRPTLASADQVRVHRSGTRFRPDWLPDPSGPLPVETLAPGRTLSLEAHGHLVLESRPAP